MESEVDTAELLEETYDQIANDPIEQKGLFGTPSEITMSPFEWYRVEEEAPDSKESVEAYNEGIDDVKEAVYAFKDQAEDAAQDLPEELQAGSDGIRYNCGSYDTAHASKLYREVAPVVAGDTDEDLRQYLEDNFHPGVKRGKTLLRHWDREYEGWEDEVARSAEDNGIVDAYETIMDQRDELAATEDRVLETIEDEFRDETGLIDRLLRR